MDLSKYSMAKYKHIVKYKTALYSFYLPVAAAMLVAGVSDRGEQFATARHICCHIGEYFQVGAIDPLVSKWRTHTGGGKALAFKPTPTVQFKPPDVMVTVLNNKPCFARQCWRV